MNHDQIINDTRDWVVKAVIGLNLCPFAKAVHVNERIRYVVSDATEPEALLKDLARELLALNRADPEQVDTTLLIHPGVLTDFLDFNDFLDAADALVEELKLDGILQIADFHPDYQFDGSAPDDIANYSNRSPYPTLHLLREESIERAVESMPDTASIYENNLETLDRLGHEGWAALGLKGGKAG
ncbi:DUF1415 domain-containing protein [Pelomonas aquatica]|jgi:hypothetical protein|uniref:DUF1415 domain-containing protein n=1 Tax=Pelomonas aquatica TaxID=431058 RepID=A0A9X4R402_9BURK|nr:DUF1415 domain-containing protein [Pelomonas aquatica]MCY4755707.1 DUF1415 domain-containing protein [Pelomonas aquatica]MDG0862692.1 DUF1415 domain-containing protein [Pelomonas aquatica]